MIIRPERKDIESYYASPALSQSRVKLILDSVDLFNEFTTDKESELFYEEKKHYVLGTACDELTTMGENFFLGSHHISELEVKPSDAQMSMCHEMLSNITNEILMHEADRGVPASEEFIKEKIMELDLDSENEDIVRYLDTKILQSHETHNYQSSWGDDTKCRNFRKKPVIVSYWNDIRMGFGKQILSAEEYDTVKTINVSWKTNLRTCHHFEDSDEIVIFYQLPVYFMMQGKECKALIDMITVDRQTGIVRAYDLKTLSNYTWKFPYEIRRRRYDFQAGWYYKALISDEGRELLSKFTDVATSELVFPLEYSFLVESTKYPGKNPLCYVLTESYMNQAIYGTCDVFAEDGRILKRGESGILEAMRIIKWHDENGYEEDRLVKVTNGEILLDLNGPIDQFNPISEPFKSTAEE